MKYVRDLTIQPYKGIARDDTKYIPTGFSSDYLTDDLMSRKLTIVTGQSEEGKSVIVHRTILNAVNEGYRVLVVDGEYYQEELIRELYLKVIGNDRKLYDLKRPNKVYIKEPKKHILPMLEKWHENKLYFISKNECDFKSFEEMFSVIVEAVKAYSIDMIVLDNMMSLVESTQSERNAAQADFVKNIIRLDRTYNVHGVIVNHPRKQHERGADIDIFDMSGTSDMPNLVDNVYIVRRVFNPTEDEPDGYLSLKKNKLNGKHKEMPLMFDEETRNYLEYDNGQMVKMHLDWQGEGKQRKLGEPCDGSEPF